MDIIIICSTHRSSGDPTLMTMGGDVALAGSAGEAPVPAALALGMERVNGSRGLAALELAWEGRGWVYDRR